MPNGKKARSGKRLLVPTSWQPLSQTRSPSAFGKRWPGARICAAEAKRLPYRMRLRTRKSVSALVGDVQGIIMKEKSGPMIGGEPRGHSGSDFEVQDHLGRKLRELFDAPPEPLPQRLLELLDQLVAKDKSRLQVNKPIKDALLALIPNLRAFAFSLSGNYDRADDLVQETLL